MYYEELLEYNYTPEIIKLFEKIVNKSSSSNTNRSKKINHLLLSNIGHESEVVSIGIQLHHFIEDVNKIDLIPSNVRTKFNALDFHLNCSDMELMELMIRIGNFEDNIFTSNLVSRGIFNSLIGWYYNNITDCKYDNFNSEQLRKQFLVGFKRWYNNDTVLHGLATKALNDILSNNSDLKEKTNKKELSKKLDKPLSKKRTS